MQTLTYYLPSLLGQVLLSYAVAAAILFTRLADLRAGGHDARFYEDYAGVGGPRAVQQTTRQLANLFEFPVLYFALIGIAIAAGVQDAWLRDGAWCFVAARGLHTVVHLGPNRLWFRTPVFMVSNGVLLAMWGRMAALAWGA